MDRKHLVYLLASFALLISTECRAQELLVTYKSLAPGIALELANPPSRIVSNAVTRSRSPLSTDLA